MKPQTITALLSCLAVAGGLLPSPCAATNRTWSGSSGIDNNWMTPGNWQGGVAPSPGDNLGFPPGAAFFGNSSNHNNFPDGTVFGSISIATAVGQSYSLGGNRVVLSNALSESANGIGVNQDASFVFFDISLTNIVGGAVTFTASHALILNNAIDTAGYELIVNGTGGVTINGTLANSANSEPGTGNLEKTNTGSLTISSTAAVLPGVLFIFDVVLDQGSLFMNSMNGNATFIVNGGSMVVDGVAGTVSARGSDVNISGTGNAGALELILVPNVTITPGDNGAPGVLQCDSLFDDGSFPSALQIKVNSTVPGTGYSQLLVNTNYNLFSPGEGFLGLAAQWNYTPQLGDSFLVLTQASGIPYSLNTNGFFSGLPPNSIDDLTNGSSMAVSYNSNGVSLSTLRTASSPFVLWEGSLSAADPSTYASRNWSFTNNWAQNVGPASGDVLVFSPYQMTGYANNNPGGITLTPIPPVTNDLASGTSLAGLLLTGTNYSLYGNPLTITGGITNNTVGGTNFCYLDIATAGPLTLDVEPGGSFLMDDVIAGSGTINKVGAGMLIYTGTTASAYVGTVSVNNGTLEVDGSFTDGSFTVNGGLLDGTGTVSAVTVNGGALKAGDSPGVLHVQGNLSMAPGSVFEAELEGPIPGSGYSQLQATGNVNLDGATLNLQPNFAASVGAAFLILVNNGASQIAGTFAGLPEGAIFQAGGQYFTISYKAGSGSKNVVVTRVATPANLTGIKSFPPTAVQLQGTGATNTTYNIFANTNLATTNWINIGTAPSDTTGVFLFNDSNVLTFPQRFYQVH